MTTPDDPTGGMNAEYADVMPGEPRLPRLGPRLHVAEGQDPEAGPSAEGQGVPFLGPASGRLGAFLKARFDAAAATPPRAEGRAGLTGPALRMHQCVQFIASMLGIVASMETRQGQADVHMREQLAIMRGELAEVRPLIVTTFDEVAMMRGELAAVAEALGMLRSANCSGDPGPEAAEALGDGQAPEAAAKPRRTRKAKADAES